MGIYWQRYGWVAPGMEISGLEDEYRLAAGKPMLLYLKRPAPDQEPRLTAMIDGHPRGRDGVVPYLRHAAGAGAAAGRRPCGVAERELCGRGGQHRAPGRRPPAGPPAELPAGTVTFLLTDIEGSTRLWETVPEAMEVALEQHNRLVTGVIDDHGGVVVTSRGEGDSFFAVFPSAVAAVEAAGACQLRLKEEAWPAGAALRVRMGLHTGEAHVQGRRLRRPRADQPVCPGEGRRARRAGPGHQDHPRPRGRAAGRRVRPEEAGRVPAARPGRAGADLPARPTPTSRTTSRRSSHSPSAPGICRCR